MSRKDFLRLGGVGLAGAALLGAADCGGSLGGNKVVKFQTIAEETSMQERAAVEIQVDRFEDEHPKYALERKVILPDEASTITNANKEMQTRLQSEDSPDVFTYDTGPGFGEVLAEAGLLRPLEDAYENKGWDIYEWARQRATYNGTAYGIPDQVEEVVVFYNKGRFLPVPVHRGLWHLASGGTGFRVVRGQEGEQPQGCDRVHRSPPGGEHRTPDHREVERDPR